MASIVACNFQQSVFGIILEVFFIDLLEKQILLLKRLNAIVISFFHHCLLLKISNAREFKPHCIKKMKFGYRQRITELTGHSDKICLYQTDDASFYIKL